MSLVVAVDGGQSEMRLRTSESDRVFFGPGVSRAPGTSVDPLASAIVETVRSAGVTDPELLVIGATAAPTDPADLDRLAKTVTQAVGARSVWTVDDSVIGHLGALDGDEGISLIVGTGIACLARVGDRARIFDGYGYLLGDDGSAWWIGRRAVRAVLLADAGRAPGTTLTAAAERRFGPLGQLCVRIHENAQPANFVAQFARDVLAAAESGDAVSLTILDKAAAALRDTALDAARWLGHPEPRLALGGRLLEPGTRLRALLDRLLRGEGLSPRDAAQSPLEGALHLARGCPEALAAFVHQWHGHPEKENR